MNGWRLRDDNAGLQDKLVLEVGAYIYAGFDLQQVASDVSFSHVSNDLEII
jgi:hypothetical protein